MFLSRNKTNNVYPCKPQFYYIKVGFKGVNIIVACFRDEFQVTNLANSVEDLYCGGPGRARILPRLFMSILYPATT